MTEARRSSGPAGCSHTPCRVRVTGTLLRLGLGPADVTGAILLTAPAPVGGADPSADGAASSGDGANRGAYAASRPRWARPGPRRARERAITVAVREMQVA